MLYFLFTLLTSVLIIFYSFGKKLFWLFSSWLDWNIFLCCHQSGAWLNPTQYHDVQLSESNHQVMQRITVQYTLDLQYLVLQVWKSWPSTVLRGSTTTQETKHLESCTLKAYCPQFCGHVARHLAVDCTSDRFRDTSDSTRTDKTIF